MKFVVNQISLILVPIVFISSRSHSNSCYRLIDFLSLVLMVLSHSGKLEISHCIPLEGALLMSLLITAGVVRTSSCGHRLTILPRFVILCCQ